MICILWLLESYVKRKSLWSRRRNFPLGPTSCFFPLRFTLLLATKILQNSYESMRKVILQRFFFQNLAKFKFTNHPSKFELKPWHLLWIGGSTRIPMQDTIDPLYFILYSSPHHIFIKYIDESINYHDRAYTQMIEHITFNTRRSLRYSLQWSSSSASTAYTLLFFFYFFLLFFFFFALLLSWNTAK